MKKLSVCFLVLTSLIAVTFMGKSGYRLFQYFSLNTTSKAFDMEWKIAQKDTSSFALEVSYQFNSLENDLVKGRIELAKPYFLNPLSAERAIESLSPKSWDVFYNKKNPSINSLQKIFPFKDCIQALITLGIFIYFLFFKKIMEKSVQEW